MGTKEACMRPSTVLLTSIVCSLAACAGSSPGKSLDQSALDPQPGVVYYIDDHLGNAHLLTDSQGNVLREENRYPFGAERGSIGDAQADYAYTGKEYDAETGLVYFGGRYYSPALGRWITPDPYFLEMKPMAAVEKALSANFYAYVKNNPVSLIDLIGLVEGSPSNIAKRKLIDAIAQGYDGSTLWAKDAKKDDFAKGTNKCNKFVYDVTKEAGAEGLYMKRPPLAGEWADTDTTIKNWRVLPKGEKPQPGDVAAYKLSGGGTSFSGHTGVMISGENDTVTNMSAHGDSVYTKKGQFLDKEFKTFRRFTGD
jgi:RHS repeat-associated protein